MVLSAVLVINAQSFARALKSDYYAIEIRGISARLYHGSASSGFDF